MTQETEDVLTLPEQTPRKELGPNTTFETVIQIGGVDRVLLMTPDDMMATVSQHFDYANNLHQDRSCAAEALTSAYNNEGITPETRASFIAYVAGVDASRRESYNVAAGFFEVAYRSSFPGVSVDQLDIPLSTPEEDFTMSIPAKTFYAGEVLNAMAMYMKTLTARNDGNKAPAITWTQKNQMKIAEIYDYMVARWKEMNLTIDSMGDEPDPYQTAYRDFLAQQAGLGTTLLTNQY